MKFCPKCETRMKPRIEQGIVLCPKCGFTADKEQYQPLSTKKSITTSSENTSGSSLKIMDTDSGPTALPTTSIECPKCGNNTAFWWMLQTRSADEATTQFYRCTVCSHTWRNYS
ncbi:MAG TPA: transcription factor S [Nitrososphaeraceae archaeon]|nr:transcription factor S [Nitrososphaeraceae archaeon]